MREIYRQSDEAFVSLDVPGFDDSLSWVSSIYSGLPSSESPSQLESPGHEDLATYIADSLLPPQTSFENLKSRLEAVRSFITSLETFTKNPYWRRAWVFQEFAVSPRPRFLAESISISYSKFDAVVAAVSTRFQDSMTSAL